MSKIYLINILLTGQLVICVSTCYGQNGQHLNKQTSKDKTTNEEKVESRKQTNQSEVKDTERENRKTQAVSILYEVISYADEIENFESQATIISNALNLLWKHNESYSRANFLKALDRFL